MVYVLVTYWAFMLYGWRESGMLGLGAAGVLNTYFWSQVIIGFAISGRDNPDTIKRYH